jgi:hypothetical protein
LLLGRGGVGVALSLTRGTAWGAGSGADIAEMSVEQFLREHGAQDAVAVCAPFARVCARCCGPASGELLKASSTRCATQGFRQNGFETVAQLVRGRC